MQAAFSVQLGIYHHTDQGEYRGREGDVAIPADLVDIVTGVHGFDQRAVVQHRKRRAAEAAATATAPAPLSPLDLIQRYDFPAGNGAGQTVAIAEFGQPERGKHVIAPIYYPGDAPALNAKYGIAAPNVNIKALNVKPLTPAQYDKLPAAERNVSWDMTAEVTMDIQIVAALCPAATVNVYFASFDQKGWIDLLDAVVADAASIPVSLSISWGLAEDSTDWTVSALQAISQRLQILAMHGVTTCVSSGDDGSGDQINDGRGHVNFPASSPFVLAVGGTMLTTDTPPQEVTWWESPGTRSGGGGATGGGVSVLFDRPSWQTVSIASINPSARDGRVMPDVAALAGAPTFDLLMAGQSAPDGGTSAATPLWAALLARVNTSLPAAKRQRFLTPLLYAANGTTTVGDVGCRDIVSGNNISNPQPGKGYAAGAGFDAATGWGVPIDSKLLDVLQSV
jgi:kumamolisin